MSYIHKIFRLYTTADLRANAGSANWYSGGESQKLGEEEHLITLHNTDYFD